MREAESPEFQGLFRKNAKKTDSPELPRDNDALIMLLNVSRPEFTTPMGRSAHPRRQILGITPAKSAVCRRFVSHEICAFSLILEANLPKYRWFLHKRRIREIQ
jgi:hypothetical protein